MARVSPPPPRSSVAVTMPALPMERVADPSNVSEAEVLSLIRREQEDALRNLIRRLRDVYALDAKRLDRELQKALTAKEQEEYNKIQAQIRAIFDAYGKSRIPLVARLAFLVGHPDPNPNSVSPAITMRPVAQKFFNESKKIRENLVVLNREFDAKINVVTDAMAQESAADRLEMVLKLQRQRDLFDAQADREARDAVKSVTDTLHLKLLKIPPRVLPASPAQTVQAPAGDTLPALNEVTSQRNSPILNVDEVRKRWLGQLQIWLALNHYRRVDAKDQGRDATTEFEQWKQNYLAGP